MVHKYSKGYRGERELVHLLSRLGYMVIRTPRSGRISLASPDIIAAKQGVLVVIECKSRKEAFTVDKEQLADMAEWKEKAGARSYIAWKLPRREWIFLHLEDVQKNRGNVGKRFAEEHGITIDNI